jgi:hypothetical protein
MKTSFSNLVDELRSRPRQEKEDLKFLLERALIEERRQEILASSRQNREELKAGQLLFSNRMRELRASLKGE